MFLARIFWIIHTECSCHKTGFSVTTIHHGIFFCKKDGSAYYTNDIPGPLQAVNRPDVAFWPFFTSLEELYQDLYLTAVPTKSTHSLSPKGQID